MSTESQSEFSSEACFRKKQQNEINYDDYFTDGTGENGEIFNFEVNKPLNLLHLCGTLTDNSTKSLEAKINKYLKKVSGSNEIFLINLLLASEEAVVQVLDDKIFDINIRLPLSEELIINLTKSEFINYNENLDPQIVDVINEVVLNNFETITLVPVLCYNSNEISSQNPRNNCLYLVCFVDPNKDDIFLTKLVNETFRCCLTLLLNTFQSEEEARQKRQCQSLLGVARKLFSHLGDLNDLLKEIMSEARRLTKAERCSLFLLDPDHMHLVAKVFDGVSSTEANNEVRIAKDQGIAGHVAATGKLLNIKNAYDHPLFYKGMDEATGFKTRNILCFPIRDEDNIVGVAQLCNKMGGNFDYFDEEIANAFSIYCGISIMHSLVYKKIQDAQARNKLSNEMMMYHMKVNDEDVARLIHCPNEHIHPDFDNFYFSPRKIFYNETTCFVLCMFQDLGFIQQFRIRNEMLCKFIIFVERGYRDTPYHNWMHAFSVSHFAYLCLKNFKLIENGYMTYLEAFAYFISCLCHDIDHRGTTNSFQQQSGSVLASLYSSEGSVMERHHLSQTLCILNTEGCNFLESLNREDYIQCLDLIKDMILSTDLATHFKIYSKQLTMAETNYDRTNSEHRNLFLCLLMTCADLSDQIKDWSVTKKVAQLIYEEFFTQGDLEKKMGKKPSDMMDRDKASIPDLQIEFLNAVCFPVFKLLAMLFPAAESLLKPIKRNILCWESSKSVFEKLCSEEGKTSLEVLTSTDLETQVQAIVEALEN